MRCADRRGASTSPRPLQHARRMLQRSQRIRIDAPRQLHVRTRKLGISVSLFPE
jgi:hypothetical protein